MNAAGKPRVYLLTPPVLDPSAFPGRLDAVLEAHDVACVRLALATRDEGLVSRAADACREVAHARDVAIVLGDHVALAKRLGLDGVHLGAAARTVREARKALGPDAIVGSHCGTSRHDGMTAGEAGADYVSFGPVAGMPGEAVAGDDLFAWWSEMIEVPVVAEGGLTPGAARRVAPNADFLGVGEEIWGDDDPAAALARLVDPIE